MQVRINFFNLLMVGMWLLIASNVHAQYMLGTTGQMAIPTAEMQESGRFMVGGNYLPDEMTPARFDYNTGNYFVNVTFLPFLELTYRCTLMKVYDGWDEERKWNQDRSLSGRLRLWKEGRFLPAVVAGTNDPVGTTLFSSAYGVATKTFTFGGHTLAATAGWYIPLKESNQVHDGPFAGLRFTPSFCKQLSVMGEYDSQGVNLGAAVCLWKHVSLYIFTRELNAFSGGIRYEYTLLH